MADEAKRPGKPPAVQGQPPAPRDEERRRPQRLAQEDLERVVGGVMVARNPKSPFDAP